MENPFNKPKVSTGEVKDKENNPENIDAEIEKQKEELAKNIRGLQDQLREIGGEDKLKEMVDSLPEEKLNNIYEKIKVEFGMVTIATASALLAGVGNYLMYESSKNYNYSGSIMAFLAAGGATYLIGKIASAFTNRKKEKN